MTEFDGPPFEGAVARRAGGHAVIPEVLDQLPAGLLVAEAPSGRILLHNGEAERILGHGAITALSMGDYVHYETLHADGRAFAPGDYPLARALAGTGCRARSMRFRRGDGRLVWLKVDAAPIHDEQGRIVAAVATFVDSTEHRSSEESLRHRLEQLVRDRTLELIERSAELDRVNAELRALSDGLEEMVRIRTAELEESRARLAHEAQHDHLTGLPNRILLEERLERAVAAAMRYGRKLAVMFIDLDGFKGVNDTLGHKAGDEVLRQVAQRLAGSVRSSDTLARLAGDEFVVLISDLRGPDAARDVALALIAAMADPFDVFGQRVTLSASIGISLFPDDALEATTLQQHADTAMYRAKDLGCGVCFYEPGAR